MIFVVTLILIFSLIFILILIYARVHSSKRQLFILPSKNTIKKMVPNDIPPLHLYLTICDYFQPFAGNVSQEIAEHRVVTWCKEYSRLAKSHNDSSGNNPIHTFFYSYEEYNSQLLDVFYRLYKDRLLELEILGPDYGEPIDNLKDKIENFRDTLFNQHGFLRKNIHDKITYGFMSDTKKINNYKTETQLKNISDRISVLLKTDCYANFSSLSKKSYQNIGKKCTAKNKSDISATSDCLIQKIWNLNDLDFIQDPTTLDWSTRKWGIWPFFENGEISADKPFLPGRVNLWLQNCINVQDSEQHLFIKLHTSGGIDQNIRYLLGENGLHQMWDYLEKLCIRHNFVLNYLPAWEMYSKIRTLLCDNLPNQQQNSSKM